MGDQIITNVGRIGPALMSGKATEREVQLKWLFAKASLSLRLSSGNNAGAFNNL